MAKDDYYVIVYKILAYLYSRLKTGEHVDTSLIKHDSTFLGINERYWTYIIKHLYDDGYVEGITISEAWGQAYIVNNLEKIMITPLGIDFLCNNSLLEKAKEFLKDIKAIASFI